MCKCHNPPPLNLTSLSCFKAALNHLGCYNLSSLTGNVDHSNQALFTNQQILAILFEFLIEDD